MTDPKTAALDGLGAALPNVLTLLSEPLERLWKELAARAPAMGSALAVLLALWIVARIARSVSERLLRVVKVDQAMENTFVGRMLAGAGDGLTPSKALASLVYAAILLLALAGAAAAVTAMRVFAA